MSAFEKFSKWLQVKIFQLEVTFGVYIYTPIEKFIFYSVLFLLVSLTTIAMVLYLPQHVQFVASRTWFYMHGDQVPVISTTSLVGANNNAAGKAVMEATKELRLGGRRG